MPAALNGQRRRGPTTVACLLLVASSIVLTSSRSSTPESWSHPRLSTCGTSATPVAFFESGQRRDETYVSSIWGILPDGRQKRMTSDYGASMPRPTADGRSITFLKRGLQVWADAPQVAHELWLHDVVTGHEELLYAGPRILNADPAPDGTRVAFAASEGRVAPPLDRILLSATKEPRTVRRLTREDGSEAVSEDQPRWAPNGRSVAYIRGEIDARTLRVHAQIRVVSLEDGRSTTLFDTGQGRYGQYFPRYIQWSPDGRHLLASVSTYTDERREPAVLRIPIDNPTAASDVKVPWRATFSSKDGSMFSRPAQDAFDVIVVKQPEVTVFSSSGERLQSFAFDTPSAYSLAIPSCALSPSRGDGSPPVNETVLR